MKIALVGESKMNDVFKETLKEKTFYNLLNTNEKVDIIIDFSHPNNLERIVSYLEKNEGIMLIIGTTGYKENIFDKINKFKASNKIIIASNFSFLMEHLREVLSLISKDVCKDCDIHLIEKHHKEKIDKPSGTALLLEKEFINNNIEIDITSIRASNVGASHEIMFMLEDEVLTLKHEVFNKKLYVKNVMKCLNVLKNMNNGIYNLKDVMNERKKNERN